MSSTWTKNENSTGELLVVVEGQDWQNAQDAAFRKLTRNLELPGFRKGTVPPAMAKNHIKNDQIIAQAANDLVEPSLVAAVEEFNLDIIAQPEVEIPAMDGSHIEYKFTLTLRPEVTLGEYKGLNIKPEEVSVSEEDVDEEVKQLQQRYAELVIKDGEAEDGDTVVLDFEGFKDGKPFEGGKGENHELVLGSNTFIPGFEDQLIGMKAGEEKDIEVTFPENYNAKELAGQPATFHVLLHDVKQRILPELDDDFAKDVNHHGAETYQALREDLKGHLLQEAKVKAQNEADSRLMDTIVDNATVEIPQVMIDEETDRLIDDFARRLAPQGLNVETFLNFTGTSEEDFRKHMSEDARKQVKTRLVLNAIGHQENLEPTPEEIESEYQSLAARYAVSEEQVKQQIHESAIAYDLRLRKAFDFVKEA